MRRVHGDAALDKLFALLNLCEPRMRAKVHGVFLLPHLPFVAIADAPPRVLLVRRVVAAMSACLHESSEHFRQHVVWVRNGIAPSHFGIQAFRSASTMPANSEMHPEIYPWCSSAADIVRASVP